jgi:hypothetical protein
MVWSASTWASVLRASVLAVLEWTFLLTTTNAQGTGITYCAYTVPIVLAYNAFAERDIATHFSSAHEAHATTHTGGVFVHPQLLFYVNSEVSFGWCSCPLQFIKTLSTSPVKVSSLQPTVLLKNPCCYKTLSTPCKPLRYCGKCGWIHKHSSVRP